MKYCVYYYLLGKKQTNVKYITMKKGEYVLNLQIYLRYYFKLIIILPLYSLRTFPIINMTDNFVVKNLDGVEEANQLTPNGLDNHINLFFFLVNIFHFFQNFS